LLKYYKTNCLCLTPEILMVHNGVLFAQLFSHLGFQAHDKSMAKRTIRIDPSFLRFTPVDWAKRGSW
jgi:hypothetical protein